METVFGYFVAVAIFFMIYGFPIILIIVSIIMAAQTEHKRDNIVVVVTLSLLAICSILSLITQHFPFWIAWF